MRKLPPLNSLQAFETAARLGSFIQAANELHLTPSAISHRIKILENSIGISLFHRINRAVVLTDAGKSFAEQIGIDFGNIESAALEITRVGKSDLINVHVVPSLAAQWLMPRIARFSATYPDIDVRITASADPVNLEEGIVDLDICYGSVLKKSGVKTELFPAEPIVAMCSPQLLQGKDGIQHIKDIERHMLIHSEINKYSWKDWQSDHPGIKLNLERGLRFDRSFMSIFAAADGLGICLESALLVERQFDAKRIVFPFGKEGPRIQCHSVSYLSSRERLPKIRIFRDWLMQALAESPGLV